MTPTNDLCGKYLGEYGTCELPTGHDHECAGAGPEGGIVTATPAHVLARVEWWLAEGWQPNHTTGKWERGKERAVMTAGEFAAVREVSRTPTEGP